MPPRVLRFSMLWFAAFVLSAPVSPVTVPIVFAAPPQDLRYNVDYQCGGETIMVGHCRKDSDEPGYPPTKPEDDFCQLYYPSRPKRGGIMAMGIELRRDVIKILTACGALKASAPDISEPDINPGTGDEQGAEREYWKGRAFLGEKNYAKAIEALEKSISLYPASAAYNDLGNAYQKLERYDEAFASYKLAIRLKPENVEARYGMGIAYEETKQYESAVAILQESLRIDPRQHDALNHLGISYFYLKQYPQAIAAFQQAARLKTDLADPHYNLGLIYQHLGQDEKAVLEYRETLRLKPSQPDACNRLGVVYTRLKQNAEAVAVLKQAIRLRPDFPNAYFNLGIAYAMMGRTVEAQQTYRALQGINPAKAQELQQAITLVNASKVNASKPAPRK